MFLTKLSLKNPVLITMLAIATVIFGFISVKTLGVELIPQTDFPYVTVTAIYAGADASTIEEDVVKKLEDSIGTLNDIKKMTSTCVDNVGFLVIQFEDHVEGPVATQNVRDKVALVKNDLPDDAEDPKIEQFDINAQAVMTLVLNAPSGTRLSEATQVAEDQVKERLQTISGVGSVDIYGGRESEIRLLLDPLKMNQLGVSPIDIINIMKSTSIEIPAGSIKMMGDTEEVSVRSFGEVQNIGELKELPIFSSGGSKVRVKDLARIEDGLEEEESASFLNLTPAIALKVKKQGSVNLVAMAEQIHAELDKIRKTLPEGYGIEVVGDQAPFTKAAVAGSISDIFLGAFMAMLIIYLFLMNSRSAIIVAVSLPTSIIGTFAFVKLAGMNLNIMSTLALSLSVGILTDDAIVIIEAMTRHLRMGKSRLRSAIDAANEVGLAVISSELALICVFGPTLFLSGVVGTLFRDFGLTIVAAILISMTVSFTVAPLLGSKILKDDKKDLPHYRLMNSLLMSLERNYVSAVRWVLHHRLMTIVVAIGLFIGGIALLGQVPGAFMPNVDRGMFDIYAELSNESSIDASKILNRELAEEMAKFEWNNFSYTTIGGGTTKEKNKVVMRIMMKPKDQRKTGQFDAMQQVRESLKDVAAKYNAKISVNIVQTEGMESTPIWVNVVGTNFKDIESSAIQLVQFMQQQEAFIDVKSSYKGYKKELVINFNHDKMSDLGLNAAQVGMAIRYMIEGEKISGITDESGEEIEIKVYVDDAYQKLDYLRTLSFTTPNRQVVKLSDFANISYGNKLVQINRVDRARAIEVRSNLKPGFAVGPVTDILTKFTDDHFPTGTTLKLSGDSEQMQESFASLGAALLAAIFLIYIVLASQFNSFIHPVTIMTALPFALTGAAASLYIFDQTLSIMAFIGIIMLMGIVTKNAILLVDYTLQRVRAGDAVHDALIESSRTRLRPILMTAGGTIIGMLPVVLSTADAAEIKHSMGFAVIGGLLFSTCVTLFVVPVFFSLVDRFRSKPDPETIAELENL